MESNDETINIGSPLKVYQRTKDLKLSAGQTWYLVKADWLKHWLSRTAFTDDKRLKDDDESVDIPPIDNSSLLLLDGSDPNPSFDRKRLRPGILVGLDCEIVSEQFWRSIVSTYGTRQLPNIINRIEYHSIPRSVISPSGVGSESVELYPPTFNIYLLTQQPSTDKPLSSNDDLNQPIRFNFSIGKCFRDLRSNIISILSNKSIIIINQSTNAPLARIWRLSFLPDFLSSKLRITTKEFYELPSSTLELINPESDDQDLNQCLLTDPTNNLILELANEDKTWLIVKNDDSEQASINRMEQLNSLNQSDPKLINNLPVSPNSTPNGINRTSNPPPPPPPPPPSSTASNLIKLSNDPSKSSNFNSIGIFDSFRRATRLGGSSGNGHSPQRPIRGLVGLINLGNTCFMNSALQCLSNCPELKRYFLSRVYNSELNKTNPLGMGGKVAESFGQLIEKIWSSEPNSSVAPREFKSIVGRFNSLFLGYGQQDSQELLTFLLDALHEDLNRVLKKPFDEIPDFEEGGGDQELVRLSEICWNLYRRRNDSVIVDLFQGQFKSTLVCPDCEKVAIKFDEIMYLTLQLPVQKTCKGFVYWIPLDVSKPRIRVQYFLQSTKDNLNFRQLKMHIGKMLGYDPDRMAVIEDWSGKPWKIWQDTDSLQGLMEKDIINIFETPLPFAALRNTIYTEIQSEVLIPVVSYRPTDRGALGSTNGSSIKSSVIFGVFFAVRLSPEDRKSYQSVYDAIVREYSRYTTQPEDLFEEDEEDEGETAEDEIENDGDVKMNDNESMIKGSERRRRAVPNLFKITVPRVSCQSPFPISNTMSGQTIELRERIKLQCTQQSDSKHNKNDGINGDFSKLAPSFESDDPEDLYEDKKVQVDNSLRDCALSDGLVSSDQPIIRAGDYFCCEWTPQSMSHFFGLDKSLPKSKNWNDPPLIQDPELVSRNAEAEAEEEEEEEEEEETTPTIDLDQKSIGIDASASSSKPSKILNKNKKKKRPNHLTIEECFKDFSKPEKLGEDDKWYCPRCKEHVQAIKRMQIWKVPDILVVHFKRFSNARTSYGRSTKVDEYVDFPIEGLDLTEEVEGIKVKKQLREQMRLKRMELGNDAAENDKDRDNDPEEEGEESLVYDLFAVDNHYGGLGGGHYTAYAKNEEDGKWHHFDDSHVSEVSSPEKVKTSAAYLLFYRRRSSKSLGSKTDSIIRNAILESRKLDDKEGGGKCLGNALNERAKDNGTVRQGGVFGSKEEEEEEEEEEEISNSIVGSGGSSGRCNSRGSSVEVNLEIGSDEGAGEDRRLKIDDYEEEEEEEVIEIDGFEKEQKGLERSIDEDYDSTGSSNKVVN